MAFEHVAAPGPQAPKYCTQCGQRLPTGDVRFCAHCGAGVQLPGVPVEEISPRKDRTPSEILRQEIDRLVGQGYRVVSQTDTSAQLGRPKVFSFVWALVWFLLFGAGILIYIFYYMAKRDDSLYLWVRADGSVQGLPAVVPPKGRTPWGYADMAMAIAVVIGSVIAVLMPIIIVIGIVTGGEMDDDDQSITAVTIGAGFLLEAVLLLAVALFTVRKYNLRWSALGFRPPKRGGYWFPVPIFFAAFTLLLVNAGIASAVGADAEGNVSDELFDSALLIVLLGILSLGLAPIMEETFFRGFLFGGLRGRWGLLGAAFASGLLFALAHFTGLSSLPLLPAIGMIGMLFAWSYHHTGSLFAPIGGHFLFNLAAFIIGVSGVAT